MTSRRRYGYSTRKIIFITSDNKIKERMGWTFGGMVVKKNYSGSFDSLFRILELKRTATGTAFDFATAIAKKNSGTATGTIRNCTVLLDPLLPYDCSYEESGQSKLDKKLEMFSSKAAVLVFMFDSISGTYAFSFFEQGATKRRWATEPGRILCNEGDYLAEEAPFIAGIATTQDHYSSEGEARVFAVLESFLAVEFSELIRNNKNLFHLFI